MNWIEIMAVFSFALVILVVYMIFRSEWVLKKRIEVIRGSIEDIEKLPSHGTMLYRFFWIWDFNKLKQKRLKNQGTQ